MLHHHRMWNWATVLQPHASRKPPAAMQLPGPTRCWSAPRAPTREPPVVGQLPGRNVHRLLGGHHIKQAVAAKRRGRARAAAGRGGSGQQDTVAGCPPASRPQAAAPGAAHQPGLTPPLPAALPLSPPHRHLPSSIKGSPLPALRCTASWACIRTQLPLCLAPPAQQQELVGPALQLHPRHIRLSLHQPGRGRGRVGAGQGSQVGCCRREGAGAPAKRSPWLQQHGLPDGRRPGSSSSSGRPHLRGCLKSGSPRALRGGGGGTARVFSSGCSAQGREKRAQPLPCLQPCQPASGAAQRGRFAASATALQWCTTGRETEHAARALLLPAATRVAEPDSSRAQAAPHR